MNAIGLQTYELIKELFFLVDDGDRQLLAQFGLTVPRFYAMVHIGENPGIVPVQLSDLMFCDKSNITRLIRGLENDLLVIREKHESDGRSYRLFLTDKGELLRREATLAHEEYNFGRFAFVNEYADEGLRYLQIIRGRLQDELRTRYYNRL